MLGLELADSAEASDALEVDMLIGADVYWSLVTGKVIRGEGGPTAIQTKIGWLLSGPVEQQEVSVNLCSSCTHTLKIGSYPAEPNLDDHLSQFWDLESLGIARDEPSVHHKFVQQIQFNGQRYEVKLPWKDYHPPLPDHYQLCHQRLTNLLKRLRRTPRLLDEYDSIIRDQLATNVVEIAPQPTQPTD